MVAIFHSAFRKNISGPYGNGRKILTEKVSFSGGILYALVQWGYKKFCIAG